MNKKEGISRLGLTIILATTLLAITIIAAEMIVGLRKEKDLFTKQIKTKEELIGKPTTTLPQIEEIIDISEDKEQPLAQEEISETKEQKPPQEVRLKELPLETDLSKKETFKEEISEDKAGRETLNIRPSAEEIKELKRRGLIIF